ncbi:endonuclease/exonuclease/phosphatase family metal-dependent hydrolase [Paenibacillus castaneae]|uniref:endonuclease/exonuclease/phosphatase family protein n=1 Tax=Paenibacillus castaneae TaxID=474957 RepID=UPI000C9BAEA6|nr:endonuclease [Paenibacillus castaneae]NIK79670.1 endonuclease/exonuclease/phosphatase family metal-dependent hydrolase [Paenibacillus castaneae]
MVKKLVKGLVSLIAAVVLLLGCFLLYITITDYKPAPVVELTVEANSENIIKQNEPFTVTTFNIGYAGLDHNQDFFMDGGKQSRSSSEEQTRMNLAAITAFMKEAASDFYLVQEVDTKSSRSYKINEASYLSNELDHYSHVFAINYKVPWVPVPILDPMGSVNSGLLTLSTFESTENLRYDLPGKESWPRQQLELDRAFLASRLPVDNGKELVLVNLHLSAFDKGGLIRRQQLEFLSDYIKKENEKGNYLIIGGDWNHALPGTDPGAFPTTQAWPEWLQPFPADFTPEGFQWVVDSSIPSVRTVDVAYTAGINFQAVIDGFLVSPNITVVAVHGNKLEYEHSDHNPVTAQFILQ